MTPQELKNSILQLAIQGKLVEQRPEEGTAEELYQQIQAEKKKLIKEGKIKKDKPLPGITEDEIPFDIPKSWKWVQFGSIVNIVSARRVHQSDWKTAGIPFYRAREIAKLAAEGFVDNQLYISQELYNELSKSGIPHSGDLMITAVGTLGKTYIVREHDNFYYKDASVICLENYARISSQYLKYIMHSEMLLNQIRNNSGGTTVATLTMVRMVNYLLPLPPLDEQKRIVAKIEELLPYIDRYEDAWSKLEDLNQRFPSDMQKSILQIAIQGKLVEQRSDEGTGEELYQQIQAEKKNFIKEGKIKKEKALPEITEDEIPFDIPESWKWVRLGNCSSYSQRKEKISKVDITSTMWSLDLEDIEKNTGRIINRRQAADRKIAGDRIKFSKGQILYSKLRPYLKKVLVAPDDGICSSEMVPFVAYGNTNAQYLVFVLVSPYVDNVVNSVTYGVKMPRVGTETMVSLPIPLPPIAEQRRIVAKLEEILPLCEKLSGGHI